MFLTLQDSVIAAVFKNGDRKAKEHLAMSAIQIASH
jgi:hypothetical protein